MSKPTKNTANESKGLPSEPLEQSTPVVPLRVVRLNENSIDHDPLPPGAYAAAAAILAARWGLTIPAGATLLVTDHGAIGQYGLAELHGGPGDRIWMASARALEEALVMATAADLDGTGIGIDEAGFERQVARMLRRRLAHFPPELLDQVIEQVPRISGLLERMVHEDH